jgi:hypothetical protein
MKVARTDLRGEKHREVPTYPARWFRQRYVRVSGFPLRGSEPQAMLRFHLPLIGRVEGWRGNP